MENILDMLGTIRRLEQQLLESDSPMERAEIAHTIDLLTPSFDRAVSRLIQKLEQEKGAA